jgi:hypothetical protein
MGGVGSTHIMAIGNGRSVAESLYSIRRACPLNCDDHTVMTIGGSTVWRWVQRKHPKTGQRKILRHYNRRGSWWASENRKLFNPNTVGTTRYRYRGTAIPTPWATTG